MKYRKLTKSEIAALESQACSADDWTGIEVGAGFSTDHVRSVRFSGKGLCDGRI